MSDTIPPERQDPSRSVGQEPAAERRDFLRGMFGFGLLAMGGTLGQSLLVRASAAQQTGQIRTTTQSFGGTRSYTTSGTVPNTITFSGTGTNTQEPGPFTFTGTPDPSAGYTFTVVGRGQTLTLAGTQYYSFTPPATNTITGNWSGSSWTNTVSRSPTYFTATVTDSRTYTYTTTTVGGQFVPPPPNPPDVDLGGHPVEDVVLCLDLPDADLMDPRTRKGRAHFLRFACGAGR
ncbi:MAG: hypothetical protein HZA53_16870 [Planctomycetes bacterium]|nr:hypothetical protein [Planctomycetota bacterium]